MNLSPTPLHNANCTAAVVSGAQEWHLTVQGGLNRLVPLHLQARHPGGLPLECLSYLLQTCAVWLGGTIHAPWSCEPASGCLWVILLDLTTDALQRHMAGCQLRQSWRAKTKQPCRKAQQLIHLLMACTYHAYHKSGKILSLMTCPIIAVSSVSILSSPTKGSIL